ncbi:hypothetical protein L596_007463 [Steinernema carpocapsae]|uniref:Uncharacterized protein n=1 Tax=Steinernema carpocapsae TaxID=34508 RepID=A0A4U5P9B9_STECR|nr:hypothetical protein L596_007463 [Steinernema carpocapsae]
MSFLTPRTTERASTFPLDKYTRFISGKAVHSIDGNYLSSSADLQVKISRHVGRVQVFHGLAEMENLQLSRDISVKSRDQRLVFLTTSDRKSGFRIRLTNILDHNMMYDAVSNFVSPIEELSQSSSSLDRSSQLLSQWSSSDQDALSQMSPYIHSTELSVKEERRESTEFSIKECRDARELSVKERRDLHRQEFKEADLSFPPLRAPVSYEETAIDRFKAPSIKIPELSSFSDFSLASESFRNKRAMLRAFQYVRMDPSFSNVLDIVRQLDEFENQQRFSSY